MTNDSEEKEVDKDSEQVLSTVGQSEKNSDIRKTLFHIHITTTVMWEIPENNRKKIQEKFWRNRYTGICFAWHFLLLVPQFSRWTSLFSSLCHQVSHFICVKVTCSIIFSFLSFVDISSVSCSVVSTFYIRLYKMDKKGTSECQVKRIQEKYSSTASLQGSVSTSFTLPITHHKRSFPKLLNQH